MRQLHTRWYSAIFEERDISPDDVRATGRVRASASELPLPSRSTSYANAPGRPAGSNDLCRPETNHRSGETFCSIVSRSERAGGIIEIYGEQPAISSCHLPTSIEAGLTNACAFINEIQ